MKRTAYYRSRLAKARARALQIQDKLPGYSNQENVPLHPDMARRTEAAVVHWEMMLSRQQDTMARRKANR